MDGYPFQTRLTLVSPVQVCLKALSDERALRIVGLWKETRTTNWNDWITVGQVGKGEKADLGVIDVGEKVRRKRAKQIASISALAAAVALVYPGWSNLYKF